MNIIVKIAIYAIALVVTYLAIGYLFHLVIFPEKKPDVKTYFQSGQAFFSDAEGVVQKVARQENGVVYADLTFRPFAPGPPKHIHTDFDEDFEVKNGELSIWVDGEVKKIKPGEIVHIPKGTPHQPFNETSDTIYLTEEYPLPENFAFGLSQVYGLMDHHPAFGKMPAMIFMMAPLQRSGFDSYLVEGPPVAIQKLINFLVTPASRLLGYKAYYEAYDVNNTDRE